MGRGTRSQTHAPLRGFGERCRPPRHRGARAAQGRGGGAGGRGRERAQLPQRGEEEGGTVSVGWSGNAVIKRGARGKKVGRSCGLIPSPPLRARNFPGEPRAHGRRPEPGGEEGEERQPRHLPQLLPGPARPVSARRARYRRRGGRAVPSREGQRGEAGCGHTETGTALVPPGVCEPMLNSGGGWDEAAGAVQHLRLVSTLSRPGSP